MHKFKLFTGTSEKAEELEQEVNSWIRENGVIIHHATGNIDSAAEEKGGLALFIFYETERTPLSLKRD